MRLRAAICPLRFRGPTWPFIRACSRRPDSDVVVTPDFEDHVGAFEHKSTWELTRALAVLRLCAVDTLVDNSLRLMRGARRVLGLRGQRALLRPTLYAQFVGGESGPEVRACMRKLAVCGSRAMMAASMEEDIGEGGSEDVYDSNCLRILEAIEMSSAQGTPFPMTQLKLSGLLSADLLVILGDFYSTRDDKVSLIKTLAEEMSGNPVDMTLFSGVLDKEKSKCLNKALGRLQRIGQEAERRGVVVLVDAEMTHLNPGLSLLTLSAAAAYNRKRAHFWNTCQCYLKEARQNLDQELKLMNEKLDLFFGVKLVRGAYMTQERTRAQRLGVPDPICPDYKTTCSNFDSLVSFLLEQTSNPASKCHLMVASHNEDSIKFTIKRMKELGIERSSGQVNFGQIYGMADQITYPLANAGYSVYKSVPYGTLEEVLPYLARRAAENKSVLQGARKEHALLAREIKRRLRYALRWKR